MSDRRQVVKRTKHRVAERTSRARTSPNNFRLLHVLLTPHLLRFPSAPDSDWSLPDLVKVSYSTILNKSTLFEALLTVQPAHHCMQALKSDSNPRPIARSAYSDDSLTDEAVSTHPMFPMEALVCRILIEALWLQRYTVRTYSS